jgi:hypothetical protein
VQITAATRASRLAQNSLKTLLGAHKSSSTPR